MMRGENNHQYGLKGYKNASWKSDTKISSYGYRLVRCLDHPMRNIDDFVFEHRLVAEAYLLTPETSIIIDGKSYLSPDYVVHHIDGDRLNNDVSNLRIMTLSEHCRLHRLQEGDENMVINFAKMHPDVIMPSKRDEDGCLDIYAFFEEDSIVIQPHETKLIPTGLKSAFSPSYQVFLKERGSTGVKGIGQRAGVIDSGYRGEWLVPITNHNDRPVIIIKKECLHEKASGGCIIYPYEKAICQAAIIPVPPVTIVPVSEEIIMGMESQRGEGKLGSSGK